jgi:predicted transcriptional regulator
MVGESLFNQRATAAAMELKAEAKRLSARGLTVQEIALRLNRSESTVRFYLMPKRPSVTHLQHTGQMRLRDKAEQMAACYPDTVRREDITALLEEL